jgi:fibronectin type 3 domain-containing protein
VSLPTATLTVEQGTRYVWSNPTTDGRALESPNRTERRAATWFDNTQLRLRLDFSSAYAGNLHLYVVDWDTTTRRQNITVTDGTTTKTVAMTNSYNQGAWLHFPINVGPGGTVRITADYVAGFNPNISGLFLGDASGSATVPGQPSLSATAGNAQVGLSWTTPADGGAAISGYRLYRGTSSGSLALYQTLGVVSGYTDSAVTNGTTYYYQVSAVNAVGEGSRSTERSATPTAPITVPGQPTLTATAGNAQVALSWTTPANGGSPISGYRLYRGTSSGSLALYQTLGVVTTYTDTAVTNGTTYYYQVSAANGVGEGSRSAEHSATPTAPSTVPSAPLGFTAAPSFPKGIDLAWSAPASNGGAAITGYAIYRSTTSGTETFLAAVPAGSTTYRDTSTKKNTRYYYIVRAVNAVGEGASSTEATAISR